MTVTFVIAMAAPSQGAPSALVQLMPFALVLAIFYFIILMPMKRRQQKVATFLASLKEGDKVVTSGGIYGTITKVGDQALQLQIAERVRIDVSKNAIVGYQGQDPVAADGSGSSS
jgi:preprotein translocase subunit YajC